MKKPTSITHTPCGQRTMVATRERAVTWFSRHSRATLSIYLSLKVKMTFFKWNYLPATKSSNCNCNCRYWCDVAFVDVAADAAVDVAVAAAASVTAISICLWLIRCHVGMHLCAPVSCWLCCCWSCKLHIAVGIKSVAHLNGYLVCFGCLSIYWSVCLLIGFYL